jgi:hypothetical protein
MDLPISVLSLVTNTLDKLNIRYVLVGSFASSIHGLYRSTADIDILADITTELVDSLYTVLTKDFYVDGLAMRRAIARGGSFNAIHLDSVFKVDIFIASTDEFAREQLSRRQLRRLSGDQSNEVYVATAEDTILAKLRWYRMGNETSNNQWNDVLGILEVLRDNLDEPYLRQWGEQLGIGDLLQRAVDEVKSQG